MALTFLNLQDIVLDHIEIDDTITRTRVKQYLNMAGRDVWERYPWSERRKDGYASTVAPYTTGTVTTTQGSATVTGVGTTWEAGWTRKFSASYSDNFYTFTRDSNTQLTLDRNFVEDSMASGSAYTIYEDRVTLDSTASSVVDVRIAALNRGSRLIAMSRDELDSLTYLPRSSGVPYRYAVENEDSSGNMGLRLWPVPDGEYEIRYTYLTSWTDLSSDSDEPVLDESKADLLILGALRWAYLLAYESQKADLARDRFEREVKRSWQDDRRRRPMTVYLRKFDGRGGSDLYHLPLISGN